MRIDDNGLTNVNATQANRVQAPDTHDQAGARPAGQRPGLLVEDRVHLSSLASSVQNLQDESVARETMLQTLATEFQSGKLNVDAERVADALIDQALGENGIEF